MKEQPTGFMWVRLRGAVGKVHAMRPHSVTALCNIHATKRAAQLVEGAVNEREVCKRCAYSLRHLSGDDNASSPPVPVDRCLKQIEEQLHALLRRLQEVEAVLEQAEQTKVMHSTPLEEAFDERLHLEGAIQALRWVLGEGEPLLSSRHGRVSPLPARKRR